MTLNEEYRLRVSENRLLKRIFGPKREEVVGGCAVPQILLGFIGGACSTSERDEKWR
jgi:hypothetical protein